jgi:hypothetical protein
MAATHITIGQTKPRGIQLQRLVNQCREVMEDFDREKAIMDTCVDAADYTLIATLYDLPSGQGQIVYDLLVAARAKVRDAATTAFVDKLG